MNLLIFRTDIQTQQKVRLVTPSFDNHPEIVQWTIDMEDIDNVLRIEASWKLNEGDIIHLMKKYGLYCESLPD